MIRTMMSKAFLSFFLCNIFNSSKYLCFFTSLSAKEKKKKYKSFALLLSLLHPIRVLHFCQMHVQFLILIAKVWILNVTIILDSWITYILYFHHNSFSWLVHCLQFWLLQYFSRALIGWEKDRAVLELKVVPGRQKLSKYSQKSSENDGCDSWKIVLRILISIHLHLKFQ